MSSYREEFPDFDPATMPVLPPGFVDQSWRNDVAPFFVAERVGLWVHYAKPEDREVPSRRFGVEVMDEDGSHAPYDSAEHDQRFPCSTDDLSEALDAALGAQFAMVLDEWLEADEYAQVRQRNALDPQAAAGGCCHSHDFCDANMAMLEAFAVIYGREPVMGEDDPAMAAQQDEDMERMNRAWSVAKIVYLTASVGEARVDDDGLTGSERRAKEG